MPSTIASTTGIWLSKQVPVVVWMWFGKAMAPHSSTLAWKIPWTKETFGLPSMGSHRVGHDWRDLAAAAAADLTSSLPLINHYIVIFLNLHLRWLRKKEEFTEMFNASTAAFSLPSRFYLNRLACAHGWNHCCKGWHCFIVPYPQFRVLGKGLSLLDFKSSTDLTDKSLCLGMGMGTVG